MIKYSSPHPLAALLKIYFKDKAIIDIMSHFEIENSTIEKVVLRTLNEMGIYQVNPGVQHDLIRQAVADIIRNSKEIYQLDQKARNEINQRKAKNKPASA